MLVTLISIIVIYTPNEKTREIHIYDLKEKEPLIEVTCAEGVSQYECQGQVRPKKDITSISYEEIQDFVKRGPYSF